MLVFKKYALYEVVFQARLIPVKVDTHFCKPDLAGSGRCALPNGLVLSYLTAASLILNTFWVRAGIAMPVRMIRLRKTVFIKLLVGVAGKLGGNHAKEERMGRKYD